MDGRFLRLFSIVDRVSGLSCTCTHTILNTSLARAAAARREQLTPLAVVAVVAKEEEVRHAIVQEVNEVVEPGPPPWRRRTRLGRDLCEGKGEDTSVSERARTRGRELTWARGRSVADDAEFTYTDNFVGQSLP